MNHGLKALCMMLIVAVSHEPARGAELKQYNVVDLGSSADTDVFSIATGLAGKFCGASSGNPSRRNAGGNWADFEANPGSCQSVNSTASRYAGDLWLAGIYKAAIWDNANNRILLPMPNGCSAMSTATHISTNGNLVGGYCATDVGAKMHAAYADLGMSNDLRDISGRVKIGGLPTTQSYITGINSSGLAVGSSDGPGNAGWHGFMIDLSGLGDSVDLGSGMTPADVTDSGHAGGTWVDANGKVQAARFSPAGVMTDETPGPGAAYSAITGLAPATTTDFKPVAVGYSCNAAPACAGKIWDPWDEVKDLNDITNLVGWGSIGGASAVNDFGLIAADADGRNVALTPVRYITSLQYVANDIWRVTLDDRVLGAPADYMKVKLATSAPGILGLPGSVNVNSGLSSAEFHVAIVGAGSVTLSAYLAGRRVSTTTVVP
jgi:hypothetical protein